MKKLSILAVAFAAVIFASCNGKKVGCMGSEGVFLRYGCGYDPWFARFCGLCA